MTLIIFALSECLVPLDCFPAGRSDRPCLNLQRVVCVEGEQLPSIRQTRGVIPFEELQRQQCTPSTPDVTLDNPPRATSSLRKMFQSARYYLEKPVVLWPPKKKGGLGDASAERTQERYPERPA